MLLVSSFPSATPDFSHFDLRFLLGLWLVAMLPAAVAAGLLMLNMIAFAPVREHRLVRSALAAAIALLVSALFFSILSDTDPGIRRLVKLATYGLVGAFPAALLAYLFPKVGAPTPSNNSFERTREG
jgi:hypothetical protein